MSRREDKYDSESRQRCTALGLHPKGFPLGDGHHTEVPITPADREIGEALAYFLGTMFCDIEGDRDYWHKKMTSVEEWSRVARALRIHGLQITDRIEPVR